MSMNSINLNSMSLAEKIKLMQLQKNGGKTATTQTVQNNSMNTSIFNNPQVKNMNSTQQTQNAQGTQGTQGSQGTNHTAGTTGTATTGTAKENIFRRLNMISQTGTTAVNQAASDKLYENPDKLETKQDITKAQTQLQVRMAKEGTNSKLEALAMKLEARREALEGQTTNGTNGTAGTTSTNTDTQTLGTSKADGEQATKEAESGQESVEKKSKESEADQKEAKDMSKEAKADSKELTKDAKALNKQMNSAKTTMLKSQQEMTQLQTQMDQNQLEIDDALNQINALQTEGTDSTGAGEKSAFSLKLAGEEDNNTPQTRSMNSTASTGSTGTTGAAGGGSSAPVDNSAQIDSLTAKIDEKINSNTEIGVRMNKVQTTQGKAVVTMQHTVEIRNKYYSKMQKSNQQQEKLSDKMLKVEQKINDIAATVETVGDITEKVGRGMEIAGNAMAASPCPPVSAAGFALSRAGGVTQKVGVVTQNVGQYGQAAAQTAMSLTYAAQGDIRGALKSAGSAIQTGASAVKGTKEMKSQMAEIDKSVQEGQQKAAVASASKQAANEAKESGKLGDLSKKEYSEGVKTQLNDQMKDGTLKQDDLVKTVKGDDAGKKINGMVDQKKIVEDATAKRAEEAANKAAGKGAKKAASSTMKKAGDWLVENGDKVGREVSALGDKFSAKKGTPQASAMVASGRTQYQRPDFSSERNELARRRAKMGMG